MEPTRVTMLMRGEKLFRNIEQRAAGRRALSGRESFCLAEEICFLCY